MILMTYFSAKKLFLIHEIKNRDGYQWDKNDTKFESLGDICQMATACFIAALLCGCTGIAGGMVLGPLFLKYDMIPQVMSGTNQYITMIASISVAIQFLWLGDMLVNYAILFGFLTIISAYIGITSINNYVKKSGKQSTITVILTFVLVVALVSLPINYILDSYLKE
jgi:uncharacterized membrane protein YfcA